MSMRNYNHVQRTFVVYRYGFYLNDVRNINTLFKVNNCFNLKPLISRMDIDYNILFCIQHEKNHVT